MVTQRHLSRAPITEALLDFRASLPEGFEVGRFLEARGSLATTFPKVEERRAFEAGFEFREGGATPFTRDPGLHGYFFRSADGLELAQFRADGFTFNRLHPYTSWDDIFPRALDLWGKYSAIAQPTGITRIAVRYINNLSLPARSDLLTHYLNVKPAVPENFPGTLTSFLTRLVMPIVEDKAAVILTEAAEAAPGQDHMTVLLDIDVSRGSDLQDDTSFLKATFETLRSIKNRIFFSSITEEAASLFE